MKKGARKEKKLSDSPCFCLGPGGWFDFMIDFDFLHLWPNILFPQNP
jgi:hypothetical protein